MALTHDVDTDEFPVPSAKTGSAASRRRSGPIEVDAAGITHPGRIRTVNEDQFLITHFGRFLEAVQTSLPPESLPRRSEDGGYGYLVADGIGGHVAGDVASQLAINTIIEQVLAMPDWILRLDDESLVEEVMRRTEDLFRHINQVLNERAKADPSLTGFGTTLTMAASIGKVLFVTSIGDSRAYLFRNKLLQQLTSDHTFAQGLADRGLISQEEVAKHRMRNVLTRSLGAESSDAQPDVQRLDLEDGDCLLLCSDGLTDMVRDSALAATLGRGDCAV
jgi:serine/threonine protein phosphatase PrpC